VGALVLVVSLGVTVVGAVEAEFGLTSVVGSVAYFANDMKDFQSSGKKSIDSLGDAEIKKLKPLPDKMIKELGGESYTQPIKGSGGKSKSDLYWNSQTGEVYTVPKNGGPPQYVTTLPT